MLISLWIKVLVMATELAAIWRTLLAIRAWSKCTITLVLEVIRRFCFRMVVLRLSLS